jgi:hypothetical protein
MQGDENRARESSALPVVAAIELTCFKAPLLLQSGHA